MTRAEWERKVRAEWPDAAFIASKSDPTLTYAYISAEDTNADCAVGDFSTSSKMARLYVNPEIDHVEYFPAEEGPSLAARPKVYVIVEGGNVQNVVCDQPVDVVVIDYDTEGVHEEDLEQDCAVIDGEYAYFGAGPWEVNPAEVAKLDQAIKDFYA